MYQTNPPLWNSDDIKQASEVDIVTFFSPSAVKFWADRVGADFRAVTLGPTTTAAAQNLKFREIRSCETIELQSFVHTLEKWLLEIRSQT